MRMLAQIHATEAHVASDDAALEENAAQKDCGYGHSPYNTSFATLAAVTSTGSTDSMAQPILPRSSTERALPSVPRKIRRVRPPPLEPGDYVDRGTGGG